MSDEWLTSEPEVGQVAWLKNDPPFGPVICFISDRGKAWKFAHGAKCLCDPSCPPWLPITTPEEQRLRKEVERLREGQRWRKWPDERPNTEGRFHVTNDGLCVDWNYFNIPSGEWDFDMTTWWRPIGELPKEKTEAGGVGDE